MARYQFDNSFGNEEDGFAPSAFACPTTGLAIGIYELFHNASDNEYELIACPACTGQHLIHRKTGKTFSQAPQ